MKFEMELSLVSIRESASVNTRIVAYWPAGVDNPLIEQEHFLLNNFTAATVYRVYTVVVCAYVSSTSCVLSNRFSAHSN